MDRLPLQQFLCHFGRKFCMSYELTSRGMESGELRFAAVESKEADVSECRDHLRLGSKEDCTRKKTMVANRSESFSNVQVAMTLEEIAELLEEQGANPFRVRAYRRAAGTVRELRGPIEAILRKEGVAGLMLLPGIGRSLAHAIEQLVQSGHLPLLERLRGERSAERIFMTVPDIGPGLAERIHEQLGIETLAELEAAAYDGRLAQIRGMGRKRIRAVRESLAGRFARRRRQERFPEQPPGAEDVPIGELLDVDEQYRRLARQGKLPRIAPRRFNPTGQAWLPVLHTERGSRHYTALFSNTARAHELGTTDDWVVIYRDDNEDQGRWTVITAHFGSLQGRRIVRGREQQCEAYYEEIASRAE